MAADLEAAWNNQMDEAWNNQMGAAESSDTFIPDSSNENGNTRIKEDMLLNIKYKVGMYAVQYITDDKLVKIYIIYANALCITNYILYASALCITHYFLYML